MQYHYRVQTGILVLGIHVLNISDYMRLQELAQCLVLTSKKMKEK
jgi:hypothetical protein